MSGEPSRRDRFESALDATPDVRGQARAALYHLIRYARADGSVFMSGQRMATMLGADRRDARAWLHVLSRHGLIRQVRRGVGNRSGGSRATDWQLELPAAFVPLCVRRCNADSASGKPLCPLEQEGHGAPLVPFAVDPNKRGMVPNKRGMVPEQEGHGAQQEGHGAATSEYAGTTEGSTKYERLRVRVDADASPLSAARPNKNVDGKVVTDDGLCVLCMEDATADELENPPRLCTRHGLQRGADVEAVQDVVKRRDGRRLSESQLAPALEPAAVHARTLGRGWTAADIVLFTLANSDRTRTIEEVEEGADGMLRWEDDATPSVVPHLPQVREAERRGDYRFASNIRRLGAAAWFVNTACTSLGCSSDDLIVCPACLADPPEGALVGDEIALVTKTAGACAFHLAQQGAA